MKKITLKGCLLALAVTGFMQSKAQQLPMAKMNTSSVQLQEQSFQLTSETKRSIETTGYGRCLTVENEAILRNKDSKRFSEEQFEEWLAPKIAEIKADEAAGKLQAVYTIPVVIHVVHDGNAVNTNGNGSNENISDAQVISQIQVLTDDYRRIGTRGGANTTGAAVDVEIEFCLAVTDPSGNPTTGIVRHNITPYSNAQTPGTTDDWEIRSDVETMKTNTQWDPTKYMNMWSIKPGGNALDHPTNPGLSGLLGYAQFPSNSGLGGLNTNGGAASTDGVVAGYSAFGNDDVDDGSFALNASYNLGRTMTHEVGHWLGLRHIWGDSACGGNGDYCNDTPDSDAANYNCAAHTSCGTSDQYQNYMDYSYDYCMDTFTADQKARVVAVMQNSPRRGILNASTACQAAAPYIAFTNTTTSVSEGTDCSYTDYNIGVSIASAPTGAANIAFNIDGGSAVNTNDYVLVNNSVTFGNGATASQDLTLRVYNDGFVEGNETIEISMTLSGSTNAQLNNAADSIVITLTDDDSVPSALTTIDVFDADFEDLTGWTVIDGDNDGNQWGGFNGLTYDGIAGAFAGSDGRTASPDQYLLSPSITLPSGVQSMSLSFGISGYQGSEPYQIYFVTDASSVATILASDLIASGTATAGSNPVVSVSMPLSLAGQTGQLVARHYNDGGSILLWDTINLDAITGTSVQTAENSGTQDQVALGASGTIYSGDASTGDIMMDIVNGNNQDYGCVSGYVSRGYNAGSPAVMYQTAGVANYVMSKAFAIGAASQQASGTGSVKFYFTEAEVSAWETATGNSRNDLVIIKDANTVSLMPGVPEVISATVGAFGTNVTLEGNFASGITGGYIFGTVAALTVSDNQFNMFGVYPNPSNGEVTISLSTDKDVNVSLFDIRGRKVYGQLHNNTSDSFNEKVNFSSMASGVYMLNVESGSKRAIKKIVIQ